MLRTKNLVVSNDRTFVKFESFVMISGYAEQVSEGIHSRLRDRMIHAQHLLPPHQRPSVHYFRLLVLPLVL
jgi:hypothetical protein